MAEAAEDFVLESKAAPEDQARAKRDGWIPPERYKGDPEKFIDADEFLKRGEEILPIVKHRLAKKDEELAQANARIASLDADLKALKESFDTMEEVNRQETKRKIEQVKKDMKAAFEIAAKDGDHAAMAEITEKMTTFNADVKAAEDEEKQRKAAKKDDEGGTKNQLTPAFKEFLAENDWYGKDRRKTLLFGSLAQDIAIQIKQDNENITEAEFYVRVLDELEKTVPSQQRGNPDKTNAARGGSRRTGGTKGYNDLPPEAKAACDSFASKLVGKGRRYEKLSDWQAAYAKQYHEEA